MVFVPYDSAAFSQVLTARFQVQLLNDALDQAEMQVSGQELFRSLTGLILIIFDIGYVDLVRSGRVLRLWLQKLFHTYGFILVRFFN